MTKQRAAIATSALLVLQLLLPPYHYQVAPHRAAYLGYGLLFYPPTYGSVPGTVNIPLLVTQLVVTGVVGFLIIRFVAKD